MTRQTGPVTLPVPRGFARRVAVRADGSGRIGLGHLMRCLAIADALALVGTRTAFYCREVPDWMAGQLTASGHALHRLNDDTAATFLEAVADFGPDRVLLDHYDIGGDWADAIRGAGTILTVLDDLAETARAAHLLIDPSPDRDAADYAALLPEEAQVLTGTAYTPLRPEFARAAPAPTVPEPAMPRIVVALGGSDPDGVTLTCLDALKTLPPMRVDVVLSRAAPHLETVRAQVASMPGQAGLLLDRTDMAQVLTGATLVIGAGGSSALERCVLGLPSVLLVLAENQRGNASALARAGTVCLAEPSAKAIAAAVAALLDAPARRSEMANAARRVCDGLGAPRVAAAIALAGAAPGQAITLRPAAPDDRDPILEWQCAPGARRYAGNPNPPTADSHARWFAARLERMSTDPFYIIEMGGAPMGLVRLDPGRVPGTDEISVLIPRAAAGRGMAHSALSLMRLAHPERHIRALVHAEHIASQGLVTGTGYHRLSPDLFESLPWGDAQRRPREEPKNAD